MSDWTEISTTQESTTLHTTPGDVTNIVSTTDEVTIVNLGEAGPRGPQGAAGAAGSTGPQGLQGPKGDPGAYYRHVQGAPSSTWIINHNLNLYPAVTVVDSSGAMVEGDITYTDINTITVTFAAAFSGEAYCS